MLRQGCELGRTGLAAIAMASLLAACGGGDGGSADTTTTAVPTPSSTAPESTAAPTSAAPTSTTLPPLQLTNNAKLSTAGLGPVRIGMTLEEAQRVSGTTFVPDDIGDDECRYYTPDRGPEGAAFMVSDGEVVRVDVFEGSIKTLSGYGVGSTDDELIEAFTERIERGPHPYTDGEYLTFVPVDELDADKRVIWETDPEGVVVAMRSGRVPFVEYIEGCA